MSNNNLIWQYFSDFWGLVPPENKGVIEENWEGLKEAMDDAYFQLYEINDSKSLRSCPTYTTRRWLLLNLTEENLNSVSLSGQRLLETNKTTVESKVNNDNTIYNTKRSVLHKHFKFIYNTTNGLTLQVPFPLDFTTVEVFRSGKLLNATTEYRIDLDTNTFTFTLSGEHTIYLSVDHTPRVADTFYEHKYVAQSSSNGVINLVNKVNQDIDSFAIVNDGSLLNPDQYKRVDRNTINCTGLSGEFEVFWIEEEEINSFVEKHKHSTYEISYNANTNGAGSVSFINIPSAPSQTVRSDSEKIFRVFVNGLKLNDNRFTVSSNQVSFSTPLTYKADEVLSISVDWINVYPNSDIKNHIHRSYQITNFQSEFTVGSYDDGGVFDNGEKFDTEEENASFNFPFEMTQINNIKIWVDGKYLKKDIDFEIKNEHIVLNVSVNNKNLKLTYHEDTRVYIYGYENLNYPNSKFSKINLGLFYDETPEYYDKNISAESSNLTFQEAVEVNFENMRLIGIPVILDGVSNWTNQYNQEAGGNINDFEIDNGLIKSDVELPEYSWCPMVYLDENRLAQNFGYLVDYETTSSLPYKAELSNFFRSLWNGPTIQNIEWGASIILGSKFITQKSQIEKIDPTVINKTIKTEKESFNVEDTNILEGDTVYAGQSTRSRVHTAGNLSENSVFVNRTLNKTNVGIYTRSEDVFTIPGKETLIVETVNDNNAITFKSVPLFTMGLLASSSTSLLSTISNPIGPGVTGFNSSYIEDVQPGMIFKTADTVYTITTQPAGDKIYLSATPTLGSTYSIYSVDSFHISEDGGFPYFTADGTVQSVDENVGQTIVFTDGSEVLLSSGISTYLQAGDLIEPYQPVSLLCDVIDYQKDNAWWIDKTEDFRTVESSVRVSLTQSLYSYERTIYVKTTEGFPESGVAGIQGVDANGFNVYERIFYEGKTDTKLINCKRGYEFLNQYQFSGAFDKGTLIKPELEYRKNTVNPIGYEAFSDNTGSNDYTDLDSLIKLFAPNVMIISISSSANPENKRLTVLNNFLDRVTEDSTRWYLNINVDYNETPPIIANEEAVIHTMYSISPISEPVNYGRVVSQIYTTTNDIFSGDQIVANNVYANVVKVDDGWIFVDYVDNSTFGIGDLITVGSSVNIITAVENKNILYYPGLIVSEWQDSLSAGIEYADTLSLGKEYGDLL